MRLCYFYRSQSDRDADALRLIPRGGSVGVVIGDTVHKLDVPPDLLRDGFEWADGA
jgi:hypothetical protein